jgi:crotonobetainyl-CoA:carnitine CoA-transferase CaiB-like acyl-CoA transferase
VLDLTALWAGPFATRLLVDMGADVIKVEGPAFADPVRFLGPEGTGAGGWNRAPYFNEYSRGKRAISLDLASPAGREALMKLVDSADIVIENWRTGVVDRLGLGYEALSARNPRISLVSMPAFGLHPAESQRPGYGPMIEQMAGLANLQGYEGGPPQKSGIAYGDPIAGTAAACGTVLALLRRVDSGRGSRVVIPQRDVLINFIGEFVIADALGMPYPVRDGNRDVTAVPSGVYRAADDRGRFLGDGLGHAVCEVGENWLALSVETDEQWAALVAVVGDGRLRDPDFHSRAGRAEGVEAIDEALSEWARERDVLDAAAALQAFGVPACPVFSPLQLVRDEHLAARGLWQTVHHPKVGAHLTASRPWRSALRPAPPVTPAPCYGEHTAEVLIGLAGLEPADLAEMERAGVISAEPKI